MSLEAIFEKQHELNKRIHSTLDEDLKDPEIRRRLFLGYELALRQESAEAVDSVSWKWWKKMEDDWDNVKIELVDMLHFWVSMCIAAQLTPQEVIDLYFKKNQLNHHRQDHGYKDGSYQKIQNGVEDNRGLL
jgi:dimeric dUTPase (all-alpha-NTP-PPase superfamily)